LYIPKIFANFAPELRNKGINLKTKKENEKNKTA